MQIFDVSSYRRQAKVVLRGRKITYPVTLSALSLSVRVSWVYVERKEEMEV